MHLLLSVIAQYSVTILKAFRCADRPKSNLVPCSDSWSEVKERFAKWKKASINQDLQMNVSKTKDFHTWLDNICFIVWAVCGRMDATHQVCSKHNEICCE